MAEFPVQYTQASPSGQVAAVRAPTSVDTGSRQIAAGLGALAEASAKVQNAQDTMSLSEVNRKGDEADYALIQSLQKITDQKEQEKLIAEHESKKAKLGEKYNPRVQAAYTKSLNDNAVSMRMKFDGVALQTRAKAAKDSFEFELQQAYEKGDELNAYLILSKARATDIIGESEFGKLTKEAPFNITMAQLRVRGEADPELAAQEAAVLKSETESQSIRKENLIGFLNGQANSRRATLRKQRDKDELGLYEQAFVKGEALTWEAVNATSMDADSKMRFWENYKTAQSQKVKTNVSSIEEGDPVVLAKVNALIDLRPGSVTPQAIYAMADKGLGTKHIPGLVDRLQGNLTDATKNPIRAKYVSELGKLHTAGVFGKVDKMATSQTYLALSQKLEAFLASKPTMEAANTFFGNLIKEDVRTFGMLGGGSLPGWDDSPLEVDITTRTGTTQTFNIQYGDVIQVDGQYLQAVGRKEGKVEWRPIPKPL